MSAGGKVFEGGGGEHNWSTAYPLKLWLGSV